MPINERVDQIDSRPGIPLPLQDLAYDGKVEAMINAGRWIVRCPDDPKGIHCAEVEFGQVSFTCPGCYPDMLSVKHKKRDDDFYDIVQDVDKRVKAKDDAKKDGREYVIIFPDNASEIMDALRQRPAVAMNWLPGETTEFLQEENAAHAVSDTKPDVSIIEGMVD
jgi:hypothetical protein